MEGSPSFRQRKGKSKGNKKTTMEKKEGTSSASHEIPDQRTAYSNKIKTAATESTC